MAIDALLRSGLMLGFLCAPLLFAFFTAYRAQTTRRNPWLWFAFGLLLAPVAGLVLLWKNGRLHAQAPRLSGSGRPDLLSLRSVP